MAKKAPTLRTTNASHRNARTTKCGMRRSHFTSQSPRESDGSSEPSTRTGYGVLFSVTGVLLDGRGAPGRVHPHRRKGAEDTDLGRPDGGPMACSRRPSGDVRRP